MGKPRGPGRGDLWPADYSPKPRTKPKQPKIEKTPQRHDNSNFPPDGLSPQHKDLLRRFWIISNFIVQRITRVGLLGEVLIRTLAIARVQAGRHADSDSVSVSDSRAGHGRRSGHRCSPRGDASSVELWWGLSVASCLHDVGEGGTVGLPMPLPTLAPACQPERPGLLTRGACDPVGLRTAVNTDDTSTPKHNCAPQSSPDSLVELGGTVGATAHHAARCRVTHKCGEREQE